MTVRKTIGYIIVIASFFYLLLVAGNILLDVLENHVGTLEIVVYLFFIFPGLVMLGLGIFLIKSVKKKEKTYFKSQSTKPPYFDKPLTIKAEVRFSEYLKGLFNVSPFMIILPLVFPVVALIQYLVIKLSEETIGEIENGFFTKTPTLYIFFIIPIVMLYLYYRQYRNTSKDEVKYLFHENIVIIKSGTVESKLDLNSIQKIKFTKNLVLIRFIKKTVSVIPKRCFNNLKEYDFFLSPFK